MRRSPVITGPKNPGRSKGTLLNIVRHIMGDYGTTVRASAFMQKGNRFELAMVVGCRFIIASEINEGEQLNEALIKGITGGDNLVAEIKFRDPFEFRPKCKVFLMTNEKPHVRGSDPIFARIKPIPFDVSFLGREDFTLSHKLASESEGILKWMIEGARLWFEEGLGQLPSSSKNLLNEYRAEMDPLGDFISNNLIVGEILKVPCVNVFARYMTWCKEREIQSLDQRPFYNQVKKRMPQIAAGKSGDIRLWKGIGLRDGESEIIAEFLKSG